MAMATPFILLRLNRVPRERDFLSFHDDRGSCQPFRQRRQVTTTPPFPASRNLLGYTNPFRKRRPRRPLFLGSSSSGRMFQETHRRNVRWGASDSLIVTDRCPPNESLPHHRRLPLNPRRTSASAKSSSADITLSRHCGIFLSHAYRSHHFNCVDVPRGHGRGKFQPSRIAESERTIRAR